MSTKETVCSQEDFSNDVHRSLALFSTFLPQPISPAPLLPDPPVSLVKSGEFEMSEHVINKGGVAAIDEEMSTEEKKRRSPFVSEKAAHRMQRYS